MRCTEVRHRHRTDGTCDTCDAETALGLNDPIPDRDAAGIAVDWERIAIESYQGLGPHQMADMARDIVAAYLAQEAAAGVVRVHAGDLAVCEHYVAMQGRTGHMAVDAAFARLFATVPSHLAALATPPTTGGDDEG